MNSHRDRYNMMFDHLRWIATQARAEVDQLTERSDSLSEQRLSVIGLISAAATAEITARARLIEIQQELQAIASAEILYDAPTGNPGDLIRRTCTPEAVADRSCST